MDAIEAVEALEVVGAPFAEAAAAAPSLHASEKSRTMGKWREWSGERRLFMIHLCFS
jgi:hypothetical protein